MEATHENIILANKAVMLQALLEEIQPLLDDLEGTNMYQGEIKLHTKGLARAIANRINTWYDAHVKVVSTQFKYHDVSQDINATMRALFKSNPAVFKIVPSFIEALKAGKVETTVEEQQPESELC